MHSDFESVFSDCSEFKELLIIQPEEDIILQAVKESVSKGRVKKNTVQSKNVEVQITDKGIQSQKVQFALGISKPNQNLPSNEKKQVAQNQNEKNVVVPKVFTVVQQPTEKKLVPQSQKSQRNSTISKSQNSQSNEKKQVVQNQNEKNGVVPKIVTVIQQSTEKKPIPQSQKSQRDSTTPKAQNIQSTEKKQVVQNQNEKNVVPKVLTEVQQSTEKKPVPQSQKPQHDSTITKSQNIQSNEKKQAVQNQNEKNVVVHKVLTEVQQLTEKNPQPQSQKPPHDSTITKSQNIQSNEKKQAVQNQNEKLQNGKKPIAQNQKESNGNNIKSNNEQSQKKEPLKPTSPKSGNKNKINKQQKSIDRISEKQTNRKESSLDKLLTRDYDINKNRDEALEKTINRLKSLEAECAEKLEKIKQGTTEERIENESRLLENTIDMLQQINDDDNSIIDNNENIQYESKQFKGKNEKKTLFVNEHTENQETIDKLKELRKKKDELLEEVIPPIETLQLQEKEALISKILDMEKLHTKLNLLMIAEHDLPKGSNYDLNRINDKFTKLQRDNKNLERRIVFLMQDNYEKIDDLKDNLRYLTKQETDVIYTYKELRSKVPDIENIQANNMKHLNKMIDEPVSSDSTTIQDLQRRLIPLTNKKGHLENTLMQLKREQIDLIDRLQHKKRLNIIQKAEYETEIKKQQAACRLLGDVKKDLLKKFEAAKQKVRDNSQCEIEKIKKLEVTLHELSEKSKKLSDDKYELVKINSSLKDQVVKYNEKISSAKISFT